ncbi:uncharacterized protein LOC105437212 [Strongylocentrotus purpuratus]|uniref:WSC domain-containing protein n=1 Tax=Strongylocentrotus purpuratus TaxID=7668 RepID=A0A7M7SWA3_STRPU|nr:uncharacterized protein LOC105437212 [Strongylocentrotus purpuratus]
MTISNCIQFCNESNRADYTYAGVENRTECYCGEASDDYSRHGVGSDANCPDPCSGDPTESCGGTGHIAVFGITTLPTTLQSPETTIYHQDTDCSKEVTSTITVGVLLACVALFGIIIALMYLNLRRSYIALKQSVSEREGQKLDPYTSLDATIMNQPTYEDIKGTRHGDRGQATTMNQPDYDDIKATRHGDRGQETTMKQPDYDDTIATTHGDRDHATTINQPDYDDTIATRNGDRGYTNEIEGVEYENQTIVKKTARVQESNLGIADENTEPEYELPIEK